MTNRIIIEPLELVKWDEFLEKSSSATIFHSSAWIRVLSETYGYKPLFVLHDTSGRYSAVMPMMEINSIITGKRGVVLPFSDFCEPLLSVDTMMSEIVDRLRLYGRERGWRYFELRGGCSNNSLSASTSFYRHNLDLSQGIEHVASKFRNMISRNIKTAEKKGVTVTISDSLQSLRQFVRLNYLTRKYHGLPPQPDQFFHKIHEHIISKGRGVTILAFHGDIPIAGAVYFHYRDQVIYKFGASDKTYQQLCANSSVMWQAIQWYTAKGFKNLCFGRTDLDNEGLRRFKTGWGVREDLVKYHKYEFHKESFVTESNKVNGFHNRLFANMPLPLLRMAGSLLYRHMG